MVQSLGYLGIALMMLLETVFPPVPSEVIMPLAGLEAEQGVITLWGAIAAGTVGAMAGNIFWFWLARTIGLERLRPLVKRHGRLFTVKWREVERADRFFDRHNNLFVCIGRMIPTIRSVVSIPAGLFEMAWRPFLVWSTIGTAIWTGLLAGAGYALGENYEAVGRYLDPVANVILALIVAAYLWRVLTWKTEA